MLPITNKTDAALSDFLHAIVPLKEGIRLFIAGNSYTQIVRKGGLISKPGSQSRYLYFIKQGVVRSYVLESGKEVTTWINEENEIFAASRTFGLQLPDIEYLQALEPTQLCRIAYDRIEEAYERFPVTNKIGRILLEENYRGAEQRAYLARIMSATKRYQRFAELQPSLLARIPSKYIASYLNMSLETLSRIRGKKHL